MPTISVIIPTYNGMNCISDTLDSVLCQTYKDYEIIIVDDGSTDNTKDVIEKYVEAYPAKVRYILQQNAGQGSARNRGIKESGGEYVAFLDHDDLWLPEKLEKQIELIDSLKDNNVVVFGDQYEFDENGVTSKSAFKEISKPHNGFVFEKLFYQNFITSQTVLAKRGFFNKVGFFQEGITYVEDFDMWLRLAKHYEFHYVQDVIAGHRIHSKQVSRNIHKMRDEHFMVLYGALKNIKGDTKFVQNAFANKHFRYGYTFWANNYPEDARLDFRLSLKHGFRIKTFLYLITTYLPSFLVNSIRSAKKSYAKITGISE
jgi:glycosyltransferase involved in cell wall biosynthesis